MIIYTYLLLHIYFGLLCPMNYAIFIAAVEFFKPRILETRILAKVGFVESTPNRKVSVCNDFIKILVIYRVDASVFFLIWGNNVSLIARV